MAMDRSAFVEVMNEASGMLDAGQADAALAHLTAFDDALLAAPDPKDYGWIISYRFRSAFAAGDFAQTLQLAEHGPARFPADIPPATLATMYSMAIEAATQLDRPDSAVIMADRCIDLRRAHGDHDEVLMAAMTACTLLGDIERHDLASRYAELLVVEGEGRDEPRAYGYYALCAAIENGGGPRQINLLRAGHDWLTSHDNEFARVALEYLQNSPVMRDTPPGMPGAPLAGPDATDPVGAPGPAYPPVGGPGAGDPRSGFAGAAGSFADGPNAGGPLPGTPAPPPFSTAEPSLVDPSPGIADRANPLAARLSGADQLPGTPGLTNSPADGSNAGDPQPGFAGAPGSFAAGELQVEFPGPAGSFAGGVSAGGPPSEIAGPAGSFTGGSSAGEPRPEFAGPAGSFAGGVSAPAPQSEFAGPAGSFAGGANAADPLSGFPGAANSSATGIASFAQPPGARNPLAGGPNAGDPRSGPAGRAIPPAGGPGPGGVAGGGNPFAGGPDPLYPPSEFAASADAQTTMLNSQDVLAEVRPLVQPGSERPLISEDPLTGVPSLSMIGVSSPADTTATQLLPTTGGVSLIPGSKQPPADQVAGGETADALLEAGRPGVAAAAFRALIDEAVSTGNPDMLILGKSVLSLLTALIFDDRFAEAHAVWIDEQGPTYGGIWALENGQTSRHDAIAYKLISAFLHSLSTGDRNASNAAVDTLMFESVEWAYESDQQAVPLMINTWRRHLEEIHEGEPPPEYQGLLVAAEQRWGTPIPPDASLYWMRPYRWVVDWY
ncbi:hypothetical protein ACIP5Y_26850 [Nocardia sp. NPDC088792]|uniref:hypothetical protein n=1 Tax=Nocardia sp. NPDC088792 TaxID=3364332 RepID=UPI003830CDE8